MYNIFQLMISIPLFMFLAFGIGFIINMLIKTTWFPVLIYLALLVYVFIEIGMKSIDYIVFSSGLIGVLLSGWTIQLLRKKGYRMF